MMVWLPPDDGPFSAGPDRTDDPDVRLTYEVVEALRTDARVGRQRITVEVQNRVAILRGTVDCRQIAETAIAVVRHVPGVRDVCDGLRSRAPAVDGGPGATSARSVRREFDAIVAGLASEESSRQSPTGTGWRLPGIVVLRLLASFLLPILVVATVTGWPGVLIACVVGAVAVEMMRVRRRRAARGPASQK
jgi:hypothetical protein